MEFRYSLVDGSMQENINGGDALWIQLVNPNDEEIDKITKEYGIPRDYLHDVLDPFEVPRTEGLKDERPDLFVFSYPIKLSETRYYTRAVSVVLLENVIITARCEDSPIFEKLKNYVIENIKSTQDFDGLVVELAWEISKIFNEFIKHQDLQIKEFENEIRTSTKTEFLQQMIEIQRSLIYFRTGIQENGLVIDNFHNLDYISETKSGKMLMHDLFKENKQAQITIDTLVSMLENLSDLYSNVISNNLNTVMKVLTSITIVLTIPTIIGGLWGMNTAVPIGKHPLAFWYLLALQIVLSLIMVYILKKKDYL
ncbi:MAG: magnesium transporter CorA family protein [Tissierellia bacterium]|nr:magnesium transporter CorA family protein [Tissierellia bacterium]